MIGRNRKGQKGFTLVELLVVMAIMAVLIGISIAGLGYAMRKSRNIARSAAASNMDKALASYYADEQRYPSNGGNIDAIATSDLDEYLEGAWDPGPPNTVLCYRANTDRTFYAICVSNEITDGTYDYICYGPGVGKTGWPSKDNDTCTTCGTCRKFGGGTTWADHGGGN